MRNDKKRKGNTCLKVKNEARKEKIEKRKEKREKRKEKRDKRNEKREKRKPNEKRGKRKERREKTKEKREKKQNMNPLCHNQLFPSVSVARDQTKMKSGMSKSNDANPRPHAASAISNSHNMFKVRASWNAHALG